MWRCSEHKDIDYLMFFFETFHLRALKNRIICGVRGTKAIKAKFVCALMSITSCVASEML